MTREEAYSGFVYRLKPHLSSQVGTHTYKNLSTAQPVAERLDHHTASTKGDAMPIRETGVCGVGQ